MTLYRLRNKGVIKARKLPGRRIGYLRSDIEEYINSLPTTLEHSKRNLLELKQK